MFHRLRIVSLVLVLISVFGVSGLTLAQGGSDICGGEPVAFNFLNFWGDAREALMNEVIASFNELCPNITVNNNVQGFDGRAELVASAVAGSNPPGLIMTTRIETYQFAQRGLIVPITGYVEASGVNPEDIFYAGEIGNQVYDGELWTYPMPTAGGITSFYFYNKELFHQAGLDPENPPETWQELEEAAQAITVLDALGIETLGASVLTNQPGGPAGESFAHWLYTNNGALFSDDGRTVTFNSPEGVETLQWMVDFTNNITGGIEATTDFWTGLEEPSADFPFYNERHGIHFANVAFFGHIQNNDPEMWADTDAWGIALRPYNGNNPDAVHAGVSGLSFAWGYIIPANMPPEVQDAAYAFLEFLGTNEAGGCHFLLAQGRPSPVKSCNEDPSYSEANPYWDTVLEALATDVSVPVTPVQAQINDVLTRAVEEAMYGADAQTVLDSAAAEAQTILDEYWASVDV